MASVTIDPQIRLKLCPELSLLLQEDISDIEVDKIQTLRKALKDSSSKLHFHQLLSKCEMILPEPCTTPRNPELEARIVKLKAQQEQREYNRMTSDVDQWRQIELEKTIDKPISKQRKYHVYVFELTKHPFICLQ